MTSRNVFCNKVDKDISLERVKDIQTHFFLHNAEQIEACATLLALTLPEQAGRKFHCEMMGSQADLHALLLQALLNEQVFPDDLWEFCGFPKGLVALLRGMYKHASIRKAS